MSHKLWSTPAWKHRAGVPVAPLRLPVRPPRYESMREMAARKAARRRLWARAFAWLTRAREPR